MLENNIKKCAKVYKDTRKDLKLKRVNAIKKLDGIPLDALEKIENGRRAPYPEEILKMAKGYNAPELCSFYCHNQCDIGKKYVPEIEMKELSEIFLKILASLNNVEEKRKKLIEITQDGDISDDEKDDFRFIHNELEKISITVETLQLWLEQNKPDYSIDLDKTHSNKNRNNKNKNS